MTLGTERFLFVLFLLVSLFMLLLFWPYINRKPVLLQLISLFFIS